MAKMPNIITISDSKVKVTYVSIDWALEIIHTFRDPFPENEWFKGYDQAATDIYAAIEALKGGEE